MQEKTKQFTTIQYLRGIAALLVVGAHTIPQIERMGYTGQTFPALASGVDIFFVISGFIMWHTAGRFSDMSALEFVKRRFVRIVPLYWLTSAMVLAVGLVAPRFLQSTATDPAYILKSFLFFPAVDIYSGKYYPFLKPGWTLNCEMFFYAIFALAILVTRNTRVRAFMVIGVLAAMTAAGLIFKPPGLLSFYTKGEFFEFALGMMLCMAFEAGRLTDDNRKAAWALLLVGWTLLIVANFTREGVPRLFAFGLPATVIMAGAIRLRADAKSLAGRALLELGDISYSLYLSHALTMSACGQLWRKAGLSDAPYLVFALLATAVCVVVGFVFHRLLERPLVKLFRDRRPALKARQAEASAL